MSDKQIALVFGATGLIGNHLTRQLLDDNRYAETRVFTRKSLGIKHPKLREIVTDLTGIEEVADMIAGDHLFCCLGTTMKKART
jgi:uncharacterized protein YbjT (DUF2867 family)